MSKWKCVDWAWLVLLSGFGVALAIPLGYVISWIMSLVLLVAFLCLPGLGIVVGVFVGCAIGGGVMGGVLGLAQRLVTKRYTRHVNHWMICSISGWAMVNFVAPFLYMLAFPEGDWGPLLWFAPLCVLVAEFIKWLLLRCRLRRTGRWVLGGAIGAAIGAAVEISWFESMADSPLW